MLKEELRTSIMARRQARGQGEITVTYCEPEVFELSPSEVEKKERRREQNRRAAQRCRRKKRMSQMSIIQNYEWIVNRNQELIQEVEKLRQERTQLQNALNEHMASCTCAQGRASSSFLASALTMVKLEPADHFPTKSGLWTDPGPVIRPACQHQRQFNSCLQNPYQQSDLGVHTIDYNSLSVPSQDNADCKHLDYPLASASPTVSSYVESVSDVNSLTSLNSIPSIKLSGMKTSCSNPKLAIPQNSSSHVLARMTLGSNPQACLDRLLSFSPADFCRYEKDAATPISTDGRRSISSVSSDISAVSEHIRDVNAVSERIHDVGASEPLNDVSATESLDDVSIVSENDVEMGGESDISTLLNQISNDDLFFTQTNQQEDVFGDTGVSNIYNQPGGHFLQSDV